MVTNKLNQLKSYQAKVAALEKELAKAAGKLRALPAKMGFTSVEALISALQEAVSGRRQTAGGSGAKVRRKRAKVTPKTKEQVARLAKEGKTVAAISAQAGISPATVHNIKKALGLVKARKA